MSVASRRGTGGSATGHGHQERIVTVGTRNVRVSVQGADLEPTPLLLFHGIGADYTLWGKFRATLTRPTVAFDVRSGYLGHRPSMRTYAGFVRELLDELELPVVDVVGLSWGGMAAQQLAHDHPGAVRRLVLASTTPGFLSVPAKPSSMAALLSPNRDAAHILEVIARIYGGDFRESPGLARELGLVRPVHEGTYRRQLLAILGWTSVPWLRGLSHETLILHSDDDPVAPFVNARLMSKLMPNAQLVVAPRGGHLFMLTRPDEYASKVNEFLDHDPRHSRGGPRPKQTSVNNDLS
jgi:pimeloyl-ACP methyl ester carboxylesterase